MMDPGMYTLEMLKELSIVTHLLNFVKLIEQLFVK